MDEKTTRPTQDEAVRAFWAILGPALADAIRDGRLDPRDYPIS